MGCVSASLNVRLGGPEHELQLTVWIKIEKEMLLEWSFFLRLSMALCPKPCAEDSIFQLNPQLSCYLLLYVSPQVRPQSH